MHQSEGEPSATQPVLSLSGYVWVHHPDKIVWRGYFGTGMFPCKLYVTEELCFLCVYVDISLQVTGHLLKYWKWKNDMPIAQYSCSILSFLKVPIGIEHVIVECSGDFFSHFTYV